MFDHLRVAAPLAGACLVASPAVAQQVPATSAAAPAIVEEAAPSPPTGIAAGFVAPAADEGGYRTPNRDLSPEEVTWHVRVALNVAALGCRDAAEAQTVAAYNAVLAADRAPLAAAADGIAARYKARYGAGWQQANDDDMTRLYNFFALPRAQAGFCAAAEEVLHEVAMVEPSDFPAFAAAALPRRESPFIATFVAYDGYRARLAGWRSTHALPRVVIATVAAVSVAPTQVASLTAP